MIVFAELPLVKGLLWIKKGFKSDWTHSPIHADPPVNALCMHMLHKSTMWVCFSPSDDCELHLCRLTLSSCRASDGDSCSWLSQITLLQHKSTSTTAFSSEPRPQIMNTESSPLSLTPYMSFNTKRVRPGWIKAHVWTLEGLVPQLSTVDLSNWSSWC